MRFLLCLCLLLSLITTTGKAQYYFIFKARGIGEAFRDCEGKAQRSVAGHAFVSLVRRDEALQQTIVDSTWGFTPNQHGLMALVSTPGHSETTCIGDLGSADFMVEVDRVTYEYAKNLKSKWVAKQYGIFANVNCVDFVKAMLDLVTPEVKLPEVLKVAYLAPTGAALLKQWYKIPKPFLSNLKQLNLARDKTARQSLANRGEPTPVATNSTFSSEPIVESKPKPVESVQTNKNLLGGKTPEELGIILLKALQTSDIKTWVRCINPEQEVNEQTKTTETFQRIRTQLEYAGLTDWKQVQFSRATFYDSGEYNGRKGARNFHVEFRYKNDEFVGYIIFRAIATITNGDKYLLWGAPYVNDTNMIRNTKR